MCVYHKATISEVYLVPSLAHRFITIGNRCGLRDVGEKLNER